MSDGKSGSDQSVLFIALLCAVVAVSMLLWWLAHDAIVRAVFALRAAEMYLAYPIAKFLTFIYSALHFNDPNIKNLMAWNSFLSASNVQNITVSDLVSLSRVVGHYLLFITTPIMLLMAIYCYFLHGSSRFNQSYSMKTLRENEVSLWPQITPVLELDLVKEDLEEGVWAMGQTPLIFCQRHGLVSKPTGTDTAWKLNTVKTQTVFALQMGPLFRSPQSMPTYMQALFVIFCACADGNRELADKLMDQISRSAKVGGQLNFSGVKENVSKMMSMRLVGWLAARHAYVYTYMASLLEIARSDGVLASSEFIWLKSQDRRLWFMLNNVGRQTAIIEVAAPFAHWLAEKRFKLALRVPVLQEAVKAADLSIKDILYVRDEDQWRNVG